MICVSLTDYNFDQLLQILPHEQLAEIRLHRLNLNLAQIQELFQSHARLIATCRPGNLSDTKRVILLQHAIKAGAAYIDIEYDAHQTFRQKLLRWAHQQGCQIIISYHNYEFTPSLLELRRILTECENLQPHLIKIVTYCHNRTDGKRLLQLYQYTNKVLIAFGMGQAGRFTRLECLKYGAPFIYAAYDQAHLTAPGQYTKSELQQIIQNGRQHG